MVEKDPTKPVSRHTDTEQISLAICFISHHQVLGTIAIESWSGHTPAVRGDGLKFAYEDLIASHGQVSPRFLFRDLSAIQQIKRLRIGIDQEQLPLLVEGQYPASIGHE
jgi:hypothetical protein